MNKKITILIAGIIVLLGIFFWVKSFNPKQSSEQAVYEKTLDLSRKYASLRYKSDNVLIKAKEYGDYDKWKMAMSEIVKEWSEYEKQTQELEKEAGKLSQDKTSFSLGIQALAYNLQEANKVIDSASPKRRIATLAKHYGVDAKMAQLILNQTADLMSSEAYREEGDVFQTCENNSMRIKNTAKVTIFVGTIVATGGTSALAASGTLAQTAVVVSGADLVLEVTEDEARIALGDKNKVTNMVSKMRTITEPAASILTLASVPGNLAKAGEKFAAVNFAAEQVRSTIQDKKILGISIKIDEKGETKAEIAGLTEEELPQWKKDNNVSDSSETIEEIIKQIEEEVKEEKPTEVPREENKKETPKTNSGNIPNQIVKIINMSGESWMMDTCFTSTCWDDLDANPEEDLDLGGIYTMGKVFGNGESFKRQFGVAQYRDNGSLVETSNNGYKITLYFALYPFEGPKNKIIEYGTWQSESIVISANYGDEPIVEWNGSNLKQVKN